MKPSDMMSPDIMAAQLRSAIHRGQVRNADDVRAFLVSPCQTCHYRLPPPTSSFDLGEFLNKVFGISPTEETEEETLKDKTKLTPGEIKKLEELGEDAHDIKSEWGKDAGKMDLWKDREGNIYVGNKNGSGSAHPTSIKLW